MPILLDSATIAEKNKLAGDHPFLVLLEISIPGIDEPIRVCGNTEDITWRGSIWQAFPFEMEEISQGNKGEVPQVEVRVGNPDRVLEPYLHEYDRYMKRNGFYPVTVNILVVNMHPESVKTGKPVVDFEFELKNPQAAGKWVTFTLGASNPFYRRYPVGRILKNVCRFKFKDTRCGYKGAEKKCEKTLSYCRKLCNAGRFGGFPGIGRAGIWIASME